MAGLPRIAEARGRRLNGARAGMPAGVPEGGWGYVVALGSNMRHHRHGLPPRVLGAALARLGEVGLVVERVSAILASAPLGPSRRRYANGAAVLRAALSPPEMLARLKAVEREFGRKVSGYRGGQRWGARVLDLDIVLWQGGCWRSGPGADGLTVPHRQFRGRGFVLGPGAMVAPGWRDPVTGLSLRQLAGRERRGRYRPRG